MTHWTKNNIPDLQGNTYVVTGANSGIGYEVSLGLAEKGAEVVLACRNEEKANSAINQIRQLVPEAKLNFLALDLSSLASIAGFANNLCNQYQKLGGLISNGGLVLSPYGKTTDGFELHFGTNYLGHFALTGQLMDLLLQTPGSRVVTVGSRMHADGEINWEDLQSESGYNALKAYKQSKLAQMLFAMELSRRLEAKGAGTIAVAAHPGLARTSWADNNLSGAMRVIGNLLSKLTYQPAAMGALSVLYAATDPQVDNGGYYGPEKDKKGYPTEVKADDKAYDEKAASQLWTISEELTGTQFSI